MKYFVIIAIAFVLLIPTTAFADFTYETLENKFSNQPIVCIYEPNVPNARQIILDLWIKETEIGILDWQYTLKQTEFSYKGQWDIDIQKISLKEQLSFDNQYCDVEIKFDATAPNASYAGVHWMEENKSQIRIVYTDIEVCKTWSDDRYRYTEWCYKEDYTRSKAMGNIATHEFGHALGLEHYESDDPDENYEWSLNPTGSPSIMTLAVPYDETKNKIRTVDLDKVKNIYGYWGFGEPKETTPQDIITFEDKNLGGFESFFVPSSEYHKERGNVKYVTIGGMVSEQAFSRGQNILLTVEFPDGEKEEWKVLATTNRQFGVQMMVNEETQVGTYLLNAKYMGYGSEKISFSVIDGMTNKVQLKKETSIPNWIRNNAAWWASGAIEDRDFIMGVQYLAQQKIIKVDNTNTNPVDPYQEIPEWVRNNAKWWGDGLITDSDFVKGIQYLAQQGIIQVR